MRGHSASYPKEKDRLSPVSSSITAGVMVWLRCSNNVATMRLQCAMTLTVMRFTVRLQCFDVVVCRDGYNEQWSLWLSCMFLYSDIERIATENHNWPYCNAFFNSTKVLYR